MTVIQPDHIFVTVSEHFFCVRLYNSHFPSHQPLHCLFFKGYLFPLWRTNVGQKIFYYHSSLADKCRAEDILLPFNVGRQSRPERWTNTAHCTTGKDDCLQWVWAIFGSSGYDLGDMLHFEKRNIYQVDREDKPETFYVRRSVRIARQQVKNSREFSGYVKMFECWMRGVLWIIQWWVLYLVYLL